MPNPNPIPIQGNDPYLDQTTSVCSSKVNNTISATASRFSQIICNYKKEDQDNMIYAFEQNSNSSRCAEPEIIKSGTVFVYNGLNNAMSQRCNDFSVRLRNSLGCLPPILKMLSSTASTSINQSVLNVLNSQGILNMNIAKLIVGLNSQLMKRRRFFAANCNRTST